ncbi:endogenous retrovirus group K member 25 Pro protein-like [Dasypus novemcinctus]|uniref:endogenous retrovirus group K member 25 Pro protein-like n=1 Tax=Dasypus novemcinctus TaxID=9361 RepID=UPI0039C95C23
MWTVPLGEQKPLMTLRVNGQWLEGLLDTGAEMSCIPVSIGAAQHWALEPGPRVVGATGTSRSHRCASDLYWEDKEGQQGTFCPLILDSISYILWGRDILHQSGAVLTTSLPPQ